VQEHEWEAAGALAHVRDLNAANSRAVQGELGAVHRRRLKEYA